MLKVQFQIIFNGSEQHIRLFTREINDPFQGFQFMHAYMLEYVSMLNVLSV